MKKLFNLFICLGLVLGMVGCSSSSSDSSSSDDDYLVVGMECNYAPFNWTQSAENDYTVKIENGYADGYDVVIASTLAEKLGKQVKIVPLDWDGLIPALNAGQIDCIIAGMTDTPERRESVNFTSKYYESEMVVIVRANSDLTNITSIQDLSGYKVLGQMSTIYDEVIDQINGVTHLTPLADYPSMVNSLKNNEADALVAELPVANGVVAANSDLAIVKFADGKGFDADTTVSIAVAKENTELLEQLENALASITTDERNAIMQAAIERQPANED